MPSRFINLLLSMFLALFLVAANAAAISHDDFFGSYDDEFDVEAYPSYNCYLYFSHDDICWIDITGDLSDIEEVSINTEPGSSSEIDVALAYQLHFLSQALPSIANSAWLSEMIDQWESTGRTQTTWVGGARVEFYMDSLGGGLMGYNVKIAF